MATGYVNRNDPASLARLTTEAICFFEAVNLVAARRRAAAEAADSRTVGQLNLAEAILHARRSFRTRSHREPGTIFDFARGARVIGDIDREHLDLVVERLLAPARVDFDQRSKLPRVHGTPNLALPRQSVRLSEDVWWYTTQFGPALSTRPVLGEGLGRARGLYRQCHDEALDPIAALIDVMVGVYDIPIEHVPHFMQVWLREAFELDYTPHLRYLLARLCDTFNQWFYGASVPPPATVHSHRPTTISLSLLLSEFVRELEERPLPGPSKLERSERERAMAQALGFYCTLRFCRVLRNRNELLGETRLSAHAREGAIRLAAAKTATGEWLQTTSAIRSAEYTYVLSKLFGVASGIPGLSYIFRGGITPNTDRGRSVVVSGQPGVGKSLLGLQMMADAAARGRLAIYIALEESYSLVTDRLVTFRLADPDRYVTVHVTNNDTKELERALAAQPRRGVLVLYSVQAGHQADLLAVLEGLANLAGSRWRWRAVVIDSLEALQVGEGTPAQSRDAGREELRALVSTVEERGFFGVILSESSADETPLLWYLADTVLELGVDATDQNRWIEIKKSRSQDFHAGRHVLRIAEGRGVVIYPSLSAIQRTLRRRVRATRSEIRAIPCAQHDSVSPMPPISEKSRVLVMAEDDVARRRWMIELLTEPSVPTDDGKAKGVSESIAVRSVLFVLFRTTELEFNQQLRQDVGLNSRWSSVHRKRVRWFSPGQMSGAQIVDELRGLIAESRRDGLPIERVAFDEIETAHRVLPQLRNEPLFWWTIAELVGVEALTACFGLRASDSESQVLSDLRASSDRVIALGPSGEGSFSWGGVARGHDRGSGQLDAEG